MADPVIGTTDFKDFDGNKVRMKSEDNGTSVVSHSIRDDVSAVPILSAPVVDSLVLSAAPCSAHEVFVHNLGGADAWLFIFDLAAKPADGARAPIVVPVLVPANSYVNRRPSHPWKCVTGCVLALSSTLNTAGAWNFTAYAHGVFDGQIGSINGEVR